jgi:hypothetical protein
MKRAPAIAGALSFICAEYHAPPVASGAEDYTQNGDSKPMLFNHIKEANNTNDHNNYLSPTRKLIEQFVIPRGIARR